MLPLSHTYVSTKVTGKNTPLLILGSILPDIATTSAEQIDRDKIHNSPKEISEYINANYPQLSDLALGIRLHSQVNGGADFYSDNTEVGYAKLEGEKISSLVADLLEIPKGDVSLVLAHNFIELAVDLHLYQSDKEIWNTYLTGIEKSRERFTKISECLSKYLEIDQNIVLKELNRLVLFLDAHSLLSPEIAVKKTVLPLIRLRFKKEVSIEETLKILNKALIITKPTYQQFLDHAVTEVKKNIISKPLVS